MREYYAYRLFQRSNEYNVLFRGSKLFQQYCVDQYAKILQYKLNWINNNQDEIRAELYSGLVDALDEGDLDNAGKKKILPASHYYSPRWYSERYLDACAIVRKYRKPDLFITFTCNAAWKEIQDELLPGEKAHDRPELTARVFNFKLKELLKDLLKDQVFGRVIAYMYTIEFQKRGLPHAHILLILAHKDKLHGAKDYDKIVCAELPDPEKEPDLFRLVTTFMIHNPCGRHTNQPCMKNGCCKANYPKDFQSYTQSNDDGYPLYQRRQTTQGGFAFKKKKHKDHVIIDNRWVVPYNPYLLEKYEAHINVEVCCSVLAIKYLYKYIYKGHDKATITLSINKIDEVQSYIDSLYISGNEACWKILVFKMHGRKPNVEPLAVHLPNGRNVYFGDKPS